MRTWQDAPPEPREAIPEAWLDILDASIKHRGPDGCGRFRQRVVRDDGTTVDVALVHRRLSIIDHEGGAQPMVVGDGTGGLSASEWVNDGTGTGGQAASGTQERSAFISREGGPYEPVRPHRCPKCGPHSTAVVFNGCIYNHRELRRELEAAGHVFGSDHSDTEVLLHGWREWGDTLFERLEGMYGVALFDAASGCLIIGRDRAGEKPLYATIRCDSSSYLFSSSAAGILRLGDRPPLDREPAQPGYITASNHFEHHVGHWIASGYDWELPIPECVDVPPATAWSLFPLSQISGSPAWVEPGQARASEPIVTTEEIEGYLDESVRAQLEADVAVGCFLSGGVDSSLVAALAKRHRPDLETFTVRMPADSFDESGFAEDVAQHLGVRHSTLDCEARPAEDLVALIHQLGLPFGDSSLLPTHWLSCATKRHCSVALSGDGGDELFCGYERYVVGERFGAWSPLLRLFPQGLLPQRDPKSPLTKASRLIEWSRYGVNTGIFGTTDFATLTGDRPSSIGRGGLRDRFDRPRQDFRTYLPCDILRKTDTASMAVALEVRAPMLSFALIAAGLYSPLNHLMPGGQRKALLREVARRHLPARIVDRPKMGFAIPIGEWFRSDYGGMRQLLLDHLESADPFPGLAEAGVEIDMGFVRRMMREHDAAGERSINPWHGRDHSQRLYMLLVLSIWCRWLRGLG